MVLNNNEDFPDLFKDLLSQPNNKPSNNKELHLKERIKSIAEYMRNEKKKALTLATETEYLKQINKTYVSVYKLLLELQ